MKEYMINSTIRTKVKLIISIISLALSVAISMLYNLLTKNIAEDNFWVVYMNVFLIPSMGAIASFLNFWFDRKLWKTKLFKKLLNTPDLSGLITVTNNAIAKVNKGISVQIACTIYLCFFIPLDFGLLKC